MLASENAATRLTQASFMNKPDFDNKPISFNRKTTTNQKFNQKIKKAKQSNNKYYNFFSGRIYFRNNEKSQNMFVYQPTLDTLELKK